MGYLNKVMLIGNLGKDPEIKTCSTGNQVCRLSLATSEKGSGEGDSETTTEWHTVVAFGRLAEICHEYLRKGRCIYVEGTLRTKTYAKEGEAVRKFTEIWAREIQFLSPVGTPVAKNGSTE